MDYRETLNLPKTDFPMRAQLPQREPEMLKYWEEINLNKLTRRHGKDTASFILHDGPPYANGNIHMGTALNKILKDIVIKFKTMQGFDSPYVPGWDTHGLPIEHQVLKTRKVNRKEVSDLEFRRLCREYAMHYVSVQREQFKRLGVRGDWENPYLTLTPEFEGKQIELFGIMAAKGFIYKGLKPVYWCPRCETALAEAEIEYGPHASDSIYVSFPVVDGKGIIDVMEDVCLLIWTTTAWTIPANLAICLHPELDYVLARAEGKKYILARELLEEVGRETGIEKWEVLAGYKGRELEGICCRHPLFERNSTVILGEHVTLEQGTGCVHTAPGHGLEDFEVGRKYGLEVLSPLNDAGFFTEEAGPFAGLRYDKGNKAVIKALENARSLLEAAVVEHQYPHCWRCKEPVLFRATEQWFASVEGFRKEALEAIQKVKWIPEWGEGRIHNMVADRQDWCISRQRIWGVPIPIFHCRECGKPVIDEDSIDAVRALFAREGSDSWYAYKAEEILPAGYKCSECGADSFKKETDTMDVWFDSGSSHAAVLENRPELSWPADLYLEGSDQYRGWFQSSLLTSVATRGEPPYRSVLSHGWVVDGEGRKMSKSLGNVIAPEEIIKQYGADILRLWVSSADFTSDIHLSADILKQLSEVYRKIRNTSRFLLGNTFDLNPEEQGVPYGNLEDIDRWALYRLNKLIKKVTRAYEGYDYHLVFHALHNFCVVDMSNFYLDVLKDTLYCQRAGDPARRSAQTAISIILDTLVRLMAPILTFTADELWRLLPGERPLSVQAAGWPEPDAGWEDEELGHRWDRLLEVREEATRILEKARQEKVIGGSLEATLTIWAGEEIYPFLDRARDELHKLFIVSKVELSPEIQDAPSGAEEGQELDLKMMVNKASGNKCPRCWVYSDGSGQLCPRCAEVTG